jgi:hypothetical protein
VLWFTAWMKVLAAICFFVGWCCSIILRCVASPKHCETRDGSCTWRANPVGPTLTFPCS